MDVFCWEDYGDLLPSCFLVNAFLSNSQIWDNKSTIKGILYSIPYFLIVSSTMETWNLSINKALAQTSPYTICCRKNNNFHLHQHFKILFLLMGTLSIMKKLWPRRLSLILFVCMKLFGEIVLWLNSQLRVIVILLFSCLC